MNVMRRLKSIASGRTSISSDPGGDYGLKRAKLDQENDNLSSDPMQVDQNLEMKSDMVSQESVAGTSNVPAAPLDDHLPEVMIEMRFKDERNANREDKDMETTVVNGCGTETGQVITTTVGGRDGKPKQTISYMAQRVVGTGSFGVVFQAKCLETGEQVAIKKVLQDKRYKNRELQIMRLQDHPNVVRLRHSFFSTTDKDELYLNLVLEYVPETVYRASKHYTKMNQHMPVIFVQLYTYQICRALNYLHRVVGVCHRDIKPQNLLVNPQTSQLKICDFGSAKMLVPGEPNISYICSRYYRAPELIFGATEYTNAIDMWSGGCVMAELLLGQPLFPGESGIDQLVEIIKILGTPTREEIRCMNPNYTEFKFPQIKAHPWHKIFHKRMPPEAVDLVSRLLQYSPNLRCTALVRIPSSTTYGIRISHCQMEEHCLHCLTSLLKNSRVHHQSCDSVLCQRMAREREEAALSWIIHSVSKSLSPYLLQCVYINFETTSASNLRCRWRRVGDIRTPGPEEMLYNWVHGASSSSFSDCLCTLLFFFPSIFLFFFHKSDPLKMFDVSLFLL